MSFDWNKYAETTGSNYVHFKEVGDQVVGRIIEIREGSRLQPQPLPRTDHRHRQRRIDDPHRRLESPPSRTRPTQHHNEGDRIRITYTGNAEAQPGRTPAKLFTVDVKPAEQIEADQAPF